MAAARAATILQSAVCRTNVKHRPAPSLFYFPGLNSKPIHDAKDFAWTRILEENVADIRKEYLALQAEKAPSDYVVNASEHKLHDGHWDWHSYVLKGHVQSAFADRCPTTAAIMRAIPGLMTGIPFAFSFFSTLKGGSKIAPHYGPSNLRVRCHLPLIVPSGCGMRIAGQDVEWKEGKCLVFDDAYEHEVWHNGTENRVLLLIDTWHPDLVPDEIGAIQDMFQHARQQGWLKN